MADILYSMATIVLMYKFSEATILFLVEQDIFIADIICNKDALKEPDTPPVFHQRLLHDQSWSIDAVTDKLISDNEDI